MYTCLCLLVYIPVCVCVRICNFVYVGWLPSMGEMIFFYPAFSSSFILHLPSIPISLSLPFLASSSLLVPFISSPRASFVYLFACHHFYLFPFLSFYLSHLPIPSLTQLSDYSLLLFLLFLSSRAASYLLLYPLHLFSSRRSSRSYITRSVVPPPPHSPLSTLTPLPVVPM